MAPTMPSPDIRPTARIMAGKELFDGLPVRDGRQLLSQLAVLGEPRRAQQRHRGVAVVRDDLDPVADAQRRPVIRLDYRVMVVQTGDGDPRIGELSEPGQPRER